MTCFNDTVLPRKYWHAVVSEVYQNYSLTRLVITLACRYRVRVLVYSGGKQSLTSPSLCVSTCALRKKDFVILQDDGVGDVEEDHAGLTDNEDSDDSNDD